MKVRLNVIVHIDYAGECPNDLRDAKIPGVYASRPSHVVNLAKKGLVFTDCIRLALLVLSYDSRVQFPRVSCQQDDMPPPEYAVAHLHALLLCRVQLLSPSRGPDR